MSTKKCSVLRFKKLPQVFNSYYLMMLVLLTCNYFLWPTSSLGFIEFCWTSENYRPQPLGTHACFCSLNHIPYIVLTAGERSKENLSTPGVTKRNLELIHFLIPLINTRNKKIKPWTHPASSILD